MSNKRLWKLIVSKTIYYYHYKNSVAEKLFMATCLPFAAVDLFEEFFEPVEDFDETPHGYFEFPERKQSTYMNTADK